MQHSPLPLVDIILCLGVPEFMVFAGFICYQFSMGALLDDRAAMEYGDLIAELAARQAVRDINSRLIAGNVVELGVDLRLCDRV